ncbi:MAG: ubiquinone biosynthesis protein UbiH, partial [Acetobacter persici]
KVARARFFTNDYPVIGRAGYMGIAGVHRLPRLRKAFVKHAMGL